MDKATAQRLVRNTLKAPFDRKRYHGLINELCNGFDDGKAQNMTVPEAFTAHVKSCQRLGTFTSPDEELADVLVVHLTESWKLERSRTALRDFVAHKLKRSEGSDNAYKEAGLIAFVAPDSQSWRFSYVRMDYETKRDPQTGKIKTEERLTPARRYSYLVGAEEECHTAQTRFLALLQNTMAKPTLAQIEEVFSVESVTKEFFNEYARLFKATDEALTAVVARHPAIRADFAAKGISTVDFAKKLLGQIVFLYFIQKKGWLGVGQGQSWGEGPRHFLRQLADQAVAQNQCLFNEVLEPLFYDTLATDRGADAWCLCLQCRIPFLNGGLFEPLAGYDWEQRSISLPNWLFTNREPTPAGDIGTGILDVFDRYNFTVNEAEPLEKEVAIDPEMLGKVFENLIEENRRKGLGAFYTPREIVHYMCQESLINYLDTTLNQSCKIIERADVEALIREGEQAAHYESARKDGTVSYQRQLPKSIEEQARVFDEALRSITVCDPAIGSGAFPVGMMTEIVRARMALTPYFDDATERTAYHFKRHAIQNSLYGVDIDSGAVEIAKLRLWLSLVVDEEDVQQIKPLPNLDYKVVAGNSLLGVEKNLFNDEYFKQLEALKPKFFDESDRAKKAQFKQQIEDLIHKLTQGREVFDFEIYFSEVFHAKGGFDVVIGNPPYVSAVEFSSKFPESYRQLLNKKYRVAKGAYDLYIIFFERGISCLCKGGILAYITPNKFLSAPYGKALREMIIEITQFSRLVNISNIPVFETASVYPVITFLVRGSSTSCRSPVLLIQPKMRYLKEFDLSMYCQIKLPGMLLLLLPDYIWGFLLSDQVKLLEKLLADSVYLSNLGLINATTTAAEAEEFGNYLTEQGGKGFFKVVNTGTIDPFKSLWGKEKMTHARKKFLTPWLPSAPLNNRRQAIYSSPKVIFAKLAKRCEVLLDAAGEYASLNTNCFYAPKDGVSLEFIAAFCSSNVFMFLYRQLFGALRMSGGYFQFQAPQLRVIPVRLPRTDQQAELETLVQRILENPNAKDVTDLEAEINDRIYRLYCLTWDEIALIESA